MYKLNRALKSQQFILLVSNIIEATYNMSESDHKLVTFYYDTEEEVLDTTAYVIDNQDFSRSMMGRLRTSSLMDQKMVNYITINTSRRDIRNELLLIIEEIEQLLLG